MVVDILENIFIQSLRNASHLFFLCSSGLSDNQAELCVLSSLLASFQCPNFKHFSCA